MTKYTVTISQTTEYAVAVEADSADEARDLAGQEIAMAGELSLKKMETGRWHRTVLRVKEA